jgi:hypothetical protein
VPEVPSVPLVPDEPSVPDEPLVPFVPWAPVSSSNQDVEGDPVATPPQFR